MFDLQQLKSLFLEHEFFFYYVGVSVLVITLFLLFQPKYKKFKSLDLYGVRWKWKWDKGEAIGLSCYCLDCGSELGYDDEYAKSTQNIQDKITFFICHNCNNETKGSIKGGDRNYALKIVRRRIMIQKNEIK